jgi:hypothetical protein
MKNEKEKDEIHEEKNEEEIPYIFHGSHDSIDIDIMYIFPKLPR